MKTCKLCGCGDDGTVYVKMLLPIKEFTSGDRVAICHGCASALIKMKVAEGSPTPCPFCGDDDIIVHHYNEKYYACCNWCGARGPFGGNEKYALDVWEKRA